MVGTLIVLILLMLALILLAPVAVLYVYPIVNTKLFGEQPCQLSQSNEMAGDAQEQFASEIDKICALILAQKSNSYGGIRLKQSNMADKFTYSVTMSAPEFKKKMGELGFECTDLQGNFKRIGCYREYWNEFREYSFSLTFNKSKGNVSFYHGSHRLISNYP